MSKDHPTAEEIEAMPDGIPTPAELLADPSTPFWAANVIGVALEKDPVDAANVFSVLAESFGKRAEQIHAANERAWRGVKP